MYKFEDRGHVKRYCDADRLQEIANVRGGGTRNTADYGTIRR